MGCGSARSALSATEALELYFDEAATAVPTLLDRFYAHGDAEETLSITVLCKRLAAEEIKCSILELLLIQYYQQFEKLGFADAREFGVLLEVLGELQTIQDPQDEVFVFITSSQLKKVKEDGRFIRAERIQPLLQQLGFNTNKQFVVNELKNLPDELQQQAFQYLINKLCKSEHQQFSQLIQLSTKITLFKGIQQLTSVGELCQEQIQFIPHVRESQATLSEFLYLQFGQYYPDPQKIAKVYGEIYAYTYSKQNSSLGVKQIFRVLQKRYSLQILSLNNLNIELYYLDRLLGNQVFSQHLFQLFVLLIYVLVSPNYDDLDLLYFASSVNARGSVEKSSFVKSFQKMLGISTQRSLLLNSLFLEMPNFIEYDLLRQKIVTTLPNIKKEMTAKYQDAEQEFGQQNSIMEHLNHLQMNSLVSNMEADAEPLDEQRINEFYKFQLSSNALNMSVEQAVQAVTGFLIQSEQYRIKDTDLEHIHEIIRYYFKFVWQVTKIQHDLTQKQIMEISQEAMLINNKDFLRLIKIVTQLLRVSSMQDLMTKNPLLIVNNLELSKYRNFYNYQIALLNVFQSPQVLFLLLDKLHIQEVRKDDTLFFLKIFFPTIFEDLSFLKATNVDNVFKQQLKMQDFLGLLRFAEQCV